MIKKAFGPSNPTVNFTAGVASSRLALPSRNVRVFNSGTGTVFLTFGDSTVTSAVASGMPVAAGAVEIFNIADATHIAGIVSSGTAVVYVTPGEGV